MNQTTLGAAPDDIAHFEAMGRQLDGAIRARIIIERAVIRHAAQALIAAGCALSVDYGEDDGFEVDKSTDLNEVMKAIGACDEEWLRVYKDGKNLGSIFFVYGNDGWDVISDYHTSLESLLESTNAFAETLS